MVTANGQASCLTAVTQNTRQFHHPFAGEDHGGFFHRRIQLGITQRQAVAIGGHGAQTARLELEQHAVQVITHILLRHGKGGAIDQATQHIRLHFQAATRSILFQIGEFRGGQSGQGKTAAAGTNQHALTIHLEANVRFRRQALGNIHQLAGRHGGLPRLLLTFQRQTRHQLQLQVCPGHGKLAVAHFQQNVGQHRQGLSLFHHGGDLL